jgi:hypothetical protein
MTRAAERRNHPVRSLWPRLALAFAVLSLAAYPCASSAEGAKSTAKKHASGRPDLTTPFPGTSYDYAWDGHDAGHPERAWLGRAYVPPEVAAEPKRPVPILVFLHGLNRELIPYRWMGGGQEGDVRRILADLVAKKLVPPMIVAAPSSVVKASVSAAETSWPAFDLDHFLDQTKHALDGHAVVDDTRILVAGHSGAGCNDRGGLATAVQAKTHLFAVLSMDTCMGLGLAKRLASAPPDTNVVVTWQEQSWASRPIGDFRRFFRRAVAHAKDAPTALRELDRLAPREPFPHDALVHLTLERWLPKLLAAPAP